MSEAEQVVLWFPWEESAEEGSYAFRSVWERIDQFLVSRSLFDGDNIEYEEVTKAEAASFERGFSSTVSPQQGRYPQTA